MRTFLARIAALLVLFVAGCSKEAPVPPAKVSANPITGETIRPPTAGIDVSAIAEEVARAGSGVKLVKHEIELGGRKLTIDAPEGSMMESSVIGVVITKGTQFCIHVDLGKGSLETERAYQPAGSIILVNSSDTLLLGETERHRFRFITTKELGYLDYCTWSDNYVNDQWVRHSREDCMLMIKCARTLSLKDQLPDEPKALLEPLGAKVKQNEQGVVTGILFGQTTDTKLKVLQRFPDLEKLDLGHSVDVTDNALAALGNRKKLTELVISMNFKMTDAGLAHLKNCTELRKIDLSFMHQISDKGIQNLAGLGKLEELRVAYAENFVGEALSHFEGVRGLRRISLRATKVSDDSLKYLKYFPDLEELDLAGHFSKDYESKLTGKGLVHIKGLTKLRMLDLGETRIKDADLANLKGLVLLESLDLSGMIDEKQENRVTDAGLVHLQHLKKLRWLELFHTQVTPDGIEKLKKALPDVSIVR